jgi:TRAP-type transport system small permease protein
MSSAVAPPPLARWTGRACDVAGLMLVAMALLIGVEIVVRGLFGTSTLVADEYSGYLFVWITMIGFAHALQGGAFLRVDSIVQRLGPRGQAAADLLSALTGLAVATACAYATAVLLAANHRFGTVSIQPSATPLWIPQVIMPVGFVALCLIYLLLLVAAWRRLRTPAT